LVTLLVLLGYFAPASLSIHFLGTNTPIWVSNAVAVAALLRHDLPIWPGLLLLAAVANLAANSLFGPGPVIGLGVIACDLSEILLVATALRRLGGPALAFDTKRQMTGAALVCLCVPVASATGGAGLLALTLGEPFLAGWTTWYLSAASGLLIVTPFLLCWTDPVLRSGGSARSILEAALLAGLAAAIGYFDFSYTALPLLFLPFPFLLLASFRGGLLGATTAAIALTVVAMWLTLRGQGPIAAIPETNTAAHLQILQVYFATVLLLTLPVAIVLEQRKRLVASLEHMARHDALTGLPNRVMFWERLAQACQDGGLTALLAVDLDRFKPVNDVHGHAAGDRLLQLVADRLRATVRETDVVARLGGDEFAIAALADSNEAQHLARRVVAALDEPFELEGATVQIGCSIGVALGSADGADAELLMQRTDAALYRAKAEGRNCFRVFDSGMDNKIRERAELEAELRRAIARDELVPHFQPLVELGTGRLVGFEMLARWPHPTRGEVPPAQFVPIAENAGLAGAMTERLLHRACHAAVAWPDHLTLATNISSVQLRDRRLPAMVGVVLAASGLPARRLEIELTESALVEDFELAREILTALKATGVRLALDDFGTGYSSLRHLQALPLDKLKIDASFVHAMAGSAECCKIVAAVVGLAHSLGLSTVAEGIEDAATAEVLRELGCDLGQGWLFGHAMPAEAVDAMLAATSAALRDVV
jgi:diguanylate cyclase (GGDEF)-like protein